MSSTHTSIILSLLQQGNVLNIPNVGTFVWRNCAVAVLSDAEHVADKDTIKQRAIQALTESYTAPAGKYYWKQSFWFQFQKFLDYLKIPNTAGFFISDESTTN